jgi:two-component system, OmpR family, copper resistance phosphate regulon response regulator CusR
MRLLLVEDEKDLREFAHEGLVREGFTVDVAKDGQEAIDLAMERPYDVVLLDVMMPRLDGFSALRTLRTRGFKGAILMTTSKGQERDKLSGFHGGADDYLVKPYLLTELVARIRAVVRRMTPSGGKMTQATLIKVGPLEMDVLKHEVKRGGKLLSLTKKEFELLEYMMCRPSQVLSQKVLAQHLTSAEYDAQTNTIEVHIKNLRSKIDAKSGPSLIRTVRGYGYALG